MFAGLKVNLHNKFDVEVRDAITGELKQKATSYNIVLTAMYSRLVNRQTFMSAIHLGTGSGTLDPSRTSLFAFTVGRGVTLDGTSHILSNLYRRVKIQLEPSEYVDTAFTEVGVAYGTASTNLLTHSLLTDSEGNPISITKTSTDVLIVYATVYFSVDTLSNNIRISNVQWDGSVTNNVLLNGLVAGQTAINGEIRIGTYEETEAATVYSNLRGRSLGYKNSSVTVDVANKKINFAAVRFEVADGNGEIKEISLSDSFNMSLPNSAYTGTTYTDVPLSGQDGSNVYFFLPSNFVDTSTIVIKVNGTPITPEIINLPLFVGYRMKVVALSGISYNPFANQIACAYANIVHIIEKDATTGEWKEVRQSPGTVGTNGVNCGVNSTYCIMSTYDSGITYIYNHVTGTLLGNVNLDRYYAYKQAISETAFLVGTGSRSTSLAILYTEDAGATWQLTGTLFYVSDNRYDYIVINHTSEVIFAPLTSGWHLYSLDPSARIITDITPGTIDTNHLGQFNTAGTALVTFGTTSGLGYYEESGDTWAAVTLPDSNPTVYNFATFIDSDTIYATKDKYIGPYSYTTQFSIWKRTGGTWAKIVHLTDISHFISFPSTEGSAQYLGYGAYRGIHKTELMLSDNWPFYARRVENASTLLKLPTAPAETDEVTVTYTMKGIHKTTNYVLDIEGYIQFGEGS